MASRLAIRTIAATYRVQTGMVADLAAENKVQLTGPLTQLVPDLAGSADPNVQKIRLIDLATNAGGLPREVPHEAGPDNGPLCANHPRSVWHLAEAKQASLRAWPLGALLELRLRLARLSILLVVARNLPT